MCFFRLFIRDLLIPVTRSVVASYECVGIRYLKLFYNNVLCQEYIEQARARK